MSYLNYNQKSTFKKFLLSTAVVSSVVCSSSAGFAMEEDERTEVTHPQKKANKETTKTKDPVKNEKDRLELLGALRAVASETCESIKKFDSLDDRRVMLLGTTGAGKSTLIHQLVGRNVFAAYPKKGSELKLLVKEEDQIGKEFVIGHGPKSCTTHPNAYHDNDNKIIWWDCPGFLDNKGIIQELSNQIAVSKLFTGERPSKILLVANHAKFEDRRGAPVWEALSSIVSMFKNSNEADDSEDNQKILQHLQNNLVFIVTHAPKNFDMKYKLAELKAAPTDSATDIERGLMKHLVSNVSTKCFTSPKPPEEGLAKLEDRNAILEALKKAPGANLVARQASVDPYSKQCAGAVTNQIRSDIELKFSEYINNFITPQITVKAPLSHLRKLKNFFDVVDAISTSKIGESEFLDKLVEASYPLGGLSDSSLHSTLTMLTSTIKDTMQIQPFLIKFGSPQLNVSQSWESSSTMSIHILERQIKNTELMEKMDEEAKKRNEDYDRSLEEYKMKHTEQLEEQRSLQEKIQSDNAAAREEAKQKLEALNLTIATFEAAQTKKEEEHKTAIQALEAEKKAARKKAKKDLEEKRVEETKRLQEKLEKKNKKIKALQEQLSNAPEGEGGALGHITKALEIIFSNTGGVLLETLTR